MSVAEKRKYHRTGFSDDNITASPDELTALTANAIENFLKSIDHKVDLHNPHSVQTAILEYFHDCEVNHKRPGNMGLYRALGINRQDWNNIQAGKLKGKITPDCMDIIQKACHILSEYREQLGATGKINPVTYIFWSKNYDGLQDNSRIEIAAETRQNPQLTTEEIQKRIEQDIPIEVEAKEIE